MENKNTTVESEKNLERKLANKIEALGGWTLKLLSTHIKGLPDRLCLLPGGRVFFAEIKTTKKKPEKLQGIIHKKLRSLGFEVYVVDSSKIIDNIIEQYK